MEPTPASSTGQLPRWARGCAVALVTAPGVLLAHVLTAGSAPSAPAVLLVAAVVALVSCVLPSAGPRSTAVAAAVAQLAGHAALALAVPRDAAGGGCLSVVGRGADALVNPSAACPPGAVAVPAGGVAVVTAVVAAAGAALLVLAGSGLLAAVSAALVVVIAAGVATVRALVAAVVPVLVGAGLLRLPVRYLPPPPAPAAVPPRSLWSPGTPARRGPPPAPATA